MNQEMLLLLIVFHFRLAGHEDVLTFVATEFTFSDNINVISRKR